MFDAWVEETGLGRGHIAEIERGMVTPSTATLAKIAAALELSISDVVAVGEGERVRLHALLADLDDHEIPKLLKDAEAMLVKRRGR